MSVTRLAPVVGAIVVARLRRIRWVSARWRDRRLERIADRVALGASCLPPARAGRPAERLLARADRGLIPGLAGRAVLSGILPVDPLRGRGAPAGVEVVIPCHARDAELLPLVLTGARAAVGDALVGFRVVAPDDHVAMLSEARGLDGADVRIVPESAVVPEPLRAALHRLVPARRYGHVLQQLIKFCGAAGTRDAVSLVLDADTVLLTPRIWALDDGRQLLVPSHERHPPYVAHHGRIWPDDPPGGISFVTHHQVMQRDVLHAMFGVDLVDGIARWLEPSTWVIERDYGSEYHDYGTWLRANAGDRAALAAFRNARGARGDVLRADATADRLLGALRARHPAALSFSLHAYL